MKTYALLPTTHERRKIITPMIDLFDNYSAIAAASKLLRKSQVTEHYGESITHGNKDRLQQRTERKMAEILVILKAAHPKLLTVNEIVEKMTGDIAGYTVGSYCRKMVKDGKISRCVMFSPGRICFYGVVK